MPRATGVRSTRPGATGWSGRMPIREDFREEYEERVAILIYDGGLPDSEAEFQAEIEIEFRQLDYDRWRASGNRSVRDAGIV